jgi:transcription termination/antitermination protein NusG
LGIDTQEKNEDDDITQVGGIFDSQDPTDGSDGERNDSGYHTATSEELVTSQVAATSTSPSSSEAAPEEQDKKHTFDSKFFAIRITGGQEHVVANILQNKITAKQIGIYSILVLDNFKGYIVVEAPDSNIAYQALAGVRHVRGQIRGELPFKDIEGYLVKKPVVSDLNIDDTVEVIAGPFKAMKAKIIRVDYEKQEATVVLLDSPYQIPVTVDANYLKRSLH